MDEKRLAELAALVALVKRGDGLGHVFIVGAGENVGDVMAELVAEVRRLRACIRETVEAHFDTAPAVLRWENPEPQRAYEAGWNAALADLLASLKAQAAVPGGEADGLHWGDR